MDLKWDGKVLTGVVKTASRPEVNLSNSTFDATTRTVKMEAEAKNHPHRRQCQILIDGKLDGTTMTGSWNHDNIKGDFKLTKK